MKSEVEAVKQALEKLTGTSKKLTAELKKVTVEDEETDECELFCTLEDMEQGIERLLESMDVTIEFLKERKGEIDEE